MQRHWLSSFVPVVGLMELLEAEASRALRSLPVVLGDRTRPSFVSEYRDHWEDMQTTAAAGGPSCFDGETQIRHFRLRDDSHHPVNVIVVLMVLKGAV
jgi:hypothetical protein